MSNTTRRLTAGIALLLSGLSLIWAVNLTAPRTVRANPGVLYAAPTAQGSGNCSSWANACTLQTALAQAISGDEIWVKAGVHYPGAAGNREATFTLKNGVALYGGFAGTETLREQRDWQANVTILSGDIDQNDINTDGNYIAETWNDIVGNNAYHVVTGSGTDDSAVLDGFVITAGQTNGVWPDYYYGGGMYNSGGSPTLTNVTFSGNWAYSGGGMYSDSGNPVLTNVTFSGNWAYSGGGMYSDSGNPVLGNATFSGNLALFSGGGMYNYDSSPTLNNVTFSGNSAYSGGGMFNYMSSPTLTHVTFSGNSADSEDGGGMYNHHESSPTLINVTFSGNSAHWGGGGMYNEYNYNSNPTLINVTFSDNSAYSGGGMHNSDSSPMLVNINFSGNSALSYGGGMYNSGGSPTLANVTFSGNSADTGGGMYNSYSSPTLTNVIVWANTATSGGSGVYNANSTPAIAYSDIQGCFTSGVWNGTCGTDDGGNIEIDPLFVDSANGNLRLRHNSPAIDAGNNAVVPAGIVTDLDGNPRFMDIPAVPDTGNGAPPIVDMGAYETLPILYAAPTVQGNGGCSSWANACTLQTALAQAVSGDEIWVKAGVHYPGAAGDRTATFTLKNGVAIYGGFAGTETLREQRDWQANKTILSGDIDQNDINNDGNYIAETWDDIQGNNAYHVVTAISVNSTAVLDGFWVTAGQANGGGFGGIHNYGSGMYTVSSNPTLTHITFSGNLAAQLGGGMYCSYSAPALTAVSFVGNSASFGGGMYNGELSPTLTSVTFSGNVATQRGGGLWNTSGSPILISVTFSGNSAVYGGGMYNDYGSPTLTNVIFSGNIVRGANGTNGSGGSNGGPGASAYGGGLYNESGSIVITGGLFDGNRATGGNGGSGSPSQPQYCTYPFGVPNCSGGYPAGDGGAGGHAYGGGLYNAAGNLTVSDTVFQNNCVTGGNGGPGGPGTPTYCWSEPFGGYYCYVGYAGGRGGLGGIGHGGSVYNNGTINLVNTPFLTSRTEGGGGGDAGYNAGNGTRGGGGGGDGYGGGLYIASAGSVSVANAVLYSNQAYGGYPGYLGNIPGSALGGGLFNLGNSVVVNGTIAHNYAWGLYDTGGGGGIYRSAGTLTLRNTIIAANFGNPSNCGGTITSGGYNLESANTCGFDQPGDLVNTDPLFVDFDNGNLRLQLTSPAIDAGNNAAVPAGIVTDLGGNPRFVDIPVVPDTGSGTPPIVDMGAYEAQCVDVVLGKAVLPSTVAPGQPIAFTLTLNNAGGLPATGIVVTDTLPAFLGDVSVTSTLAVTDTGNLPPYVWQVQDLAPGQSGVITVSGVLTRPLAAGTYTNTALLSATGDLLAGNNTAVITFTVSNVAPVFTGAPVVTATQDVPYTYTATARDDNGDALAITAPTLPAWLTLVDHGDGTATLSGTPTNAEVGEHPVVLRVADSGGLTDTQAFTITVANVNDAPFFTSAPVLTATQDAPYTYAVTTDDPDLIHGDSLAITAPTLPAWLTLVDHGDGTATLSGTPSNADVGEHPVLLRVADSGGLTDTQAFTITVANVNDAPHFTSAPVLTATQDAPYTYAVAAADPDLIHGDALTITAPTLPAWLTLVNHGDGTATLAGTPANAEVGEHPVLLRVADSGGLSDTQAFTITVANVNDAPHFTSAPVLTATQDAPYTYAVAAADPDLIHGDALTITAPVLPAWLSLVDHGDGTATLSGTPTDTGDYTVVLRVADRVGAFAEQEFVITVYEKPRCYIYIPLVFRNWRP